MLPRRLHQRKADAENVTKREQKSREAQTPRRYFGRKSKV